MNSIKARIAAIIASFIMARVTSMGVADLSPNVQVQIEQWVGNSFELIAFLGYAIIHPWLQKKLNNAPQRVTP